MLDQVLTLEVSRAVSFCSRAFGGNEARALCSLKLKLDDPMPLFHCLKS